MVDFHVHGVVVLLFTLSKVLCTELDLAIPESGTVIEEFASDSLQLSFFCRLLNSEGSQIVTTWFSLSEEGKAEGRSPAALTSSNNRFNLSGDRIMAGSFQIPSDTNLTVNALTTDLHNSTLSCGTGDDFFIAVFSIFAYVNPSIPGNLDVILDDLSATITWETPVNLGNPEISYYTLIILDDQGNTHVNETLPAPGTTMFTLPGLLPLTNYTVTLTAVSQLAPTPVLSPTASFNFSTTTTVPLVKCRTASIATDQRSVRIEWENIHTGGLDLISATIEYAVLPSSENNSTPVDNPVVDINGGTAVLRTLPEVGLDYVFTVSTENTEGESIPSQCPPIFLVIGAPSTPDKPIVRADGPVAILTLQTAKSGTGNSALTFAFSVLVYRFNETSNTSQLVSEEERFNSSEYTNNESIKIHVQDVMELNQLYHFAARAVNAFGMSEISSLSDAILLNVSQPTISRVDTQQRPDGIEVSWTFLHTGGSELQLVEIFLREDRDGATSELVPGGNLSRPLSNSFMIDGSNLQAGVGYEIAVRATNDLGVSGAIFSEIQESRIGVPAVPVIPTLSSSTSTSITLILSTAANGLIRPDDTLTFHLRVTTTDANGNSETSYENGEFSAEMSRDSVRLTVPAETGVSYVFSVRAENRFGSSEYSGDSESITIPEPTEGGGEDTGELEMREVIGIAVGVGVVVLLLLFCCILLVCALLTRGGKESHKMEGEAGLEMQDNSLYKQSKKLVENREEFPSEAFESQYEAPPDDGHTVPLRPKPTHPSGAPIEGTLPVYDSLNPAGRHLSTYSSTSSKELPNPLYSGTKPTSQHDSGSGVIHSRGVVGGGTAGSGGGEEPLYSEASVLPETNGGVYTEPDSRGSKLLDSFSAPPPPPPDPRTIPTASPPLKTAPLVDGSDEPPTYAEAGPAGSEEHLYSELPDHHRHPDTSSPSHPPHFRIPPPPPTQPPPSSTPLPSDSTEEPSHSVPSRAGSQNRTGI